MRPCAFFVVLCGRAVGSAPAAPNTAAPEPGVGQHVPELSHGAANLGLTPWGARRNVAGDGPCRRGAAVGKAAPERAAEG